MDLRCVNAGYGGYFYKSHLPRLGPSQQMSHSKEQSTEELPSLSSKAGATGSTGSLPQEGAGSVDVTSPDFQVKVSCNNTG